MPRTTERTGAYPVQPEDSNTPGVEATGGYPIEPDKGPRLHRARRIVRRGVVGVLAVGAAGGVAFAVHEYRGYETAHADKQTNERKIANANSDKVDTLTSEQASGEHIPILGKVVVLLPDANIRSSTKVINSRVWHTYHVPGNSIRTVAKDQAVVLSGPIVRNVDGVWVQAVPEPLQESDFTKPAMTPMPQKSIEALAEVTISAKLSTLLAQENAMVCDIPKDPGNFTTVSKDNSYRSPDGGAAATYSDVPLAYVLRQEQDGNLQNCSYTLTN